MTILLQMHRAIAVCVAVLAIASATTLLAGLSIAGLPPTLQLPPEDATHPEPAFPNWRQCSIGGEAAERLSARTGLLDLPRASDPRPAALTHRAKAHLALGDLHAAFADANTALEIDPLFANAYLRRGLIQAARGHLDQAAADLRIAARMDADVRPALDRVQQAQAARTRYASPSQGEGGPASRRVALVIDNGCAGEADAPTVRDAKAMAGLFRELGFQTVSLHLNLAAEATARSVAEFEREASFADWAVVYLSGYSDFADGEVLFGTTTRQFPLHHVLQRLQGARVLRLVMLDSQPTITGTLQHPARLLPHAIPAGVSEKVLPTGTVVAFAARVQQDVSDGPHGEPSAFAAALLRRMREPGVDIGMLFRRVREDVLAATQGRQDPILYGSLPGVELFLRR